MKIPQAQRTVQDVAPQLGKMNMMNVPTNVDMFGGAQAKQLAGLGADLNKFAQMGFKLGDELATTEAQEKLTQFQKNFAGWKVEAQKRKGKDGMGTGADYRSWSEGAMQALTKDMDGLTRSKFMARAEQMNTQYGYWADSYGAGEEQAYKVTTQQAVIASNADLLALNIGDPELAEQSIMETMNAARTLAQMQGLGAEATKQLEQNAVRQALMPAIGSVIDSGNLRDAKAMMEQYGGLLGGVNMQKLNSAVQREGKRQAAEYRANQEKAKNEEIFSFAEGLSRQGENYGSLPELNAAGLAAIEEKYGDDIEAKNKAVRVFQSELSFQETMVKAKASSDLVQFARDTQGMTPTKTAQFYNDNSTKYQGSSKVAIEDYMNNVRTKETDDNLAGTQDILLAIDLSNDAVNPLSKDEILAMADAKYLTPKQIEEVLEYSEKGGVVGAITFSQLNTAWKDSGHTGKTVKPDFISFVEKNVPRGKEATPQDINKAAMLWKLKGNTSKEDGWFSDFRTESYAEAQAEGRELLWLPTIDEIPEDVQQRIDLLLQANQYTVNEYNKLLYYKVNVLGLRDDRKLEGRPYFSGGAVR